MEQIKILLSNSPDFIPKDQIEQVNFVFCGEGKNQVTDNKWLQSQYKTPMIFCENDSVNKIEIFDNFKYMYMSFFEMLFLYDRKYLEQLDFIFVRYNVFDNPKHRNILCAWSYLTRAYIIALNNSRSSYIFDPYGECEFGRTVYSNEVIGITTFKMREVKTEWANKLQTMALS